jgi:hypothetical protein
MMMECERVPRGVCPVCHGSIGLEKINVATQFPCPHCNRLLRVSQTYRVLLYVACYGAPTVAVLFLTVPIVIRIIDWLVYAFIFGFAFLFIGKRLCTPRLQLAKDDSNDQFQSLGLGR